MKASGRIRSTRDDNYVQNNALHLFHVFYSLLDLLGEFGQDRGVALLGSDLGAVIQPDCHGPRQSLKDVRRAVLETAEVIDHDVLEVPKSSKGSEV